METSQLRFIDTHCHLYATEFDIDRNDMISRAVDTGIAQMMLPNIDYDTVNDMLSLARQYGGICFPMIGLHPCSVDNNYEKKLDKMRSAFQHESFAGIGETGIDLYWETSNKDLQINAFEHQIGWAKEMDLPVIIHSRESLDLNLDIIERNQDGKLRGIFHCFGGNQDQARRIEDLGFKAGIGGVVTFKNSELEKILPLVSPNLIVLETDAPYLTPTPHRGKRNEPSYLILIAQKVANILGMSMKEVADLTTANANDVFRKKS